MPKSLLILTEARHRGNFRWWLFAFLFFAASLAFGLRAHTQLYPTFKFFQMRGDSYPEHVVLDGFWQSLPAWSLNYILTWFLGWRMLRAMMPLEFRSSCLLAGSFWLGFLGICSLNRVIQLGLAGSWSYAVLVSSIVFIAYQGRSRIRSEGYQDLRDGWRVVLAMAPFLILALMHSVAQFDFRWVGHGPQQYAESWAKYASSRLPLVTQHYDELIFHSFLIQPTALCANPILPWWLTLGFMKASVVAFIFMVVRYAGASVPFALAAAAFDFFGTASILPHRYFPLFDSQNPLFYVVHSGRLLVAPFLLLFFIWQSHRWRCPTWVMVLLGIGITSTSFSNWFWLPVLTLFSSSFCQEKLKKAALVGFAGTPLLFLSLESPIHPVAIGIFLAFLLYCMKPALSWRSLAQGWRLSQDRPFWIAMTAASLFLGNMLAKAGPGKLFSRAIQLPQWDFHQGGLKPLHLYHLFSNVRESSAYMMYGNSFGDYIACYGAFVCLVLLAWFVIQWPPSKKWEAWFVGLMCSWPVWHFVINEMDIAQRSWTLTRFVEGPYYLLTTFSFLGMDRHLKGIARYLFLAGIAVYSVTPFIATERIQQIFSNLTYFLSL